MNLAQLLLYNWQREAGTKQALPRRRFFITEAGKTPYRLFKSLCLEKQKQWCRLHSEGGRRIHEQAFRTLAKLGLLNSSEVKVGDTLFKGSADAIITLPGEKPALLEIKSLSPHAYNRMLLLGRPRAATYLQVQLYLNYLRNLRQAKLLYIERTEGNRLPRMREFEIRPKDRTQRQIIRKFQALKEKFVRSGVMSR